MQIPILNGVYTDGVADFRTSYPINMVPVPKENGISSGYLRPADGIVANGTGPGESRGAIVWDGTLYRVMGTKLVSIDSLGTVTTLADVGGTGQVVMDYSFDQLAIASGGNLYYWDGSTLTQVTDPDLGTVVDFCWVDGYFLTTDGEFLIVTELNDPTSVNPLKYGSSESDPDPINAVMKLRNEVYALNRYTIEVFDNVGGDFFPFQRVTGAQIQKGAIGTHCSTVFMDAIAFLGSGRNESPSVYMAANSSSVKISSREIDQILAEYSEIELSEVVLETRNGKAHNHLWIRLPDQVLVYDASASQVLGTPVWFHMTSGVIGYSEYKAKDLAWCYGRWNIAESGGDSIGYLDDSVSTHFGEKSRWEFGTIIAYNEGRGAIFHSIELVSLTGRVAFGLDPQISTTYSDDGVTWGQEKYISVGQSGNRSKRIQWLQQGAMRHWRIQRFRGDSDSFISFARLDAQIEPLAW